MAAADLASYRLCAQGVVCNYLDPHETVAGLTAIQAQDRTSALWAIGLRSVGSTIQEVERTVEAKRIVRTWLMRGTLHFTAAEDVRWMLALVGPKIISGSKRRDAELHLDEEVYGRSREVLTRTLEAGPLARSKVMSTLESAGISIAGQRGYHILRRLALEGLICFGPMIGKEASIVLLDEWVPRTEVMSREETLTELARRYFTGHGPATVQDLVWWAGITVTEARRALESARPQLDEAVVGGVSYWSAPYGRGGREGRAHLLPAFDEYIIGYRDRGAVLDGRHTAKVLSSNGIFYPSIVIDGQARGTWKGTRSRGMRVEARPFSPVSGEELKLVKEAAERYARFLGQRVELSVR
ncbi:MAG: winged helix DNA-binding domain-containing protein [Methanomassiliicoccus sp.]|nr:winged helix DNA-binding domain-containing protein [Methanomassiliicoccus sp.]